MTTVYLGGPINGCTDEEAKGWREAVKPILRSAGYQYLDPMDRDYRGRELEPGIATEIVELDKADIRASDVLLVNSPYPSYGTAMEIFYGWSINKVVIAVVPEDVTPSPWVTFHATVHKGSIVEVAKLLAELRVAAASASK